ncbi:MAG: hypothetical protein AB8G95_14030 [Anaerolineae bacterium]
MQITSNQQREKNGAERILGNPALRKHLDDEQTEKLFQWGFGQIEEIVTKLEAVPDADANPTIDKFVDRIILLMRCLNLLTLQLDHEVRDETTQPAVDDFLQAAAEFKDQDEQAVMLLQTAISHPADWSAESAFDFLFSFLDGGETE